MKQILTILTSLCVIPISAIAQTISYVNNPRVGDKFDVDVIDVMSAGAAGRDCVWDFSNAASDNSQKMIKYMECQESPDCIMKISDNMRYYERVSIDRLLILGMENNTLKIEYDKPVTLAAYPMGYGDSIRGNFYGRGKYCDKFGVRVVGEYVTKADATGVLILPDGNSVCNVVRLHTRRDFSMRLFSTDSVWVSRKDYTDSEIHQHLQNDSVIVAIETYGWYASGYRYPLLEFHTESINGNVYTSSAYCFSVFGQSALLDCENEAIRAEASNVRNSEQGDALGMLPYIFHFDKSKGTVSITSESTMPIDMEAVLASVGGITYQTVEKKEVTSATLNLNCSHLPQGQYAVYIRIGNNCYTEKFSL